MDLYAPPQGKCGCSDSPMVVCRVMYENADGTRDTLFYRQQCQECGFVRKWIVNGVARNLYWTMVGNGFNYDWLNFHVAKDFKGDRNGLSEFERKKLFLRKIIKLADKSEGRGNLIFTSADLRD